MKYIFTAILVLLFSINTYGYHIVWEKHDTNQIGNIAFSKDGNSIFANFGSYCALMDIKTGNIIRKIDTIYKNFSPDFSLALIKSDDTINIFRQIIINYSQVFWIKLIWIQLILLIVII